MKNYLPRLVPMFVMALLMGSAHAQISLEDLDLDQDVSSWYDDNSGAELLEIYEGKIFQLNINITTRKTFSAFKSAQWIDGTVMFRGKRYDEIPLKYDLFSDQLTVLNVAGSPLQPIIPNQQDIAYFDLEGDYFQNLSTENSPEGEAGFYHVLYDGPQVALYAKYSKRQVVEGRKLEFVRSEKAFLKNGDQFVRVKNKGSFFLAFPEHKAAIKSFCSANALKIKPSNQSALISLTEYCESLTGSK